MGIVGYLLNVIFVFVERRLLGWYFGIPRRARRHRTAPTSTGKPIKPEA